MPTPRPINVTIWNEFRHERQMAEVKAIYPDGIHASIAAGIDSPGLNIKTATLDQPDHGLGGDVLAQTDVLLWWGHMAHREVEERIVDAVQARVLAGMGLVVLHSGHHSKVFKRLMGTSCNLVWREADGGERERVWIVNPGHAIAQGIGDAIEIAQSEMYGEPFDIPTPDELVFVSWMQGGEVFRSGCCFKRGRGRIFYFSPGHEAFAIYKDPRILKVIANAVRWANAPHHTGSKLDVSNRRIPPEAGAPTQSR